MDSGISQLKNCGRTCNRMEMSGLYLCYCPEAPRRTRLESLLSSHGGRSPIEGREAQNVWHSCECNHKPWLTEFKFTRQKWGQAYIFWPLHLVSFEVNFHSQKVCWAFSECTFNLHSFQPVWWWTTTRRDKTRLRYHCKEESLWFLITTLFWKRSYFGLMKPAFPSFFSAERRIYTMCRAGCTMYI